MRPILSLDYQLDGLKFIGIYYHFIPFDHSIAILLSDSNLFIKSEIVYYHQRNYGLSKTQ